MKKYLLMLMMSSVLVLGACGNANEELSVDEGSSETASADTSSSDSKEKGSSEPKKEEEPKKEDSKVKESKIGKLTIVNRNKGLDITKKTGPFKLTVLASQVAILEPSKQFKEMFDGKDKATIITLEVRAENTKDMDAIIYPDQGTITTNTGAQAQAKVFMSDSVGGEFFGKVHKEGSVIFQVDAPAKEIKKVTFIVGAPSDKEYMPIGENVKIEIPIK